VNNAGILRDKSFSKMTLDEFRQVLDVHVFGSVVCTKMVWDHMKQAGYGRTDGILVDFRTGFLLASCVVQCA
jgi:NAD(P)-dependent dehydrogenase (short-subunit alcohol dehydrogenase family)